MQVVLIALLLAGCELKDASSDDSGSGGDDGVGGEANLPDLTDDLDTTGCDDWEGNEIPGSASYFYGIYEYTGTDDEGLQVWHGEEYWLIHANQTWQEDGHSDCQVVWTGDLTEASPGHCGTCDLGLEGTLVLDLTSTDCPENLYIDEDEADVGYGLRYTSDEEVTWYFSGSGNEFATGYYNENAANFLSEKQCDWF